ncbi:MAG TPA: hypothetical protein VEU77_12235 [Candidatus Acidoferrales bacterium]|nr:hypothetical protein [Candidatus Acidoferrales bacterium]
MSGNAFAWSSDGGGIVVAIDNNCQEICAVQGGHPKNELWTIDLASAATERVASNGVGKTWLPVAWDRVRRVVAAGVTGPGGYLTGYDVVDLNARAVRSTEFQPTVMGRLKASSDARFVLLTVAQGGTSTSLAWWPLAEPEKRTDVAFDAEAAEWRPGTSEIWWTTGFVPAGCRTAPCAATDVVAFDVASGARRTVLRGNVGSLLVGFRADASAAITEMFGTVHALVLVDTHSGVTASVPVSAPFAGSVRLR